jgi:hypothetical protein
VAAMTMTMMMMMQRNSSDFVNLALKEEQVILKMMMIIKDLSLVDTSTWGEYKRETVTKMTPRKVAVI